jgi:hypothetical protein
VKTSVNKSPTNCLSHTDGIIPSVKLWNLVVSGKPLDIRQQEFYEYFAPNDLYF